MGLAVVDLHSNEMNNSCKCKYPEVKSGSLTRVMLHLNAFFPTRLTMSKKKKSFITQLK